MPDNPTPTPAKLTDAELATLADDYANVKTDWQWLCRVGPDGVHWEIVAGGHVIAAGMRYDAAYFVAGIHRRTPALIAELRAARADVERLAGERDAAVTAEQWMTASRNLAIRQANDRDQKWMDGINEIVGEKLSYDFPDGAASRGLDTFVRELRKERDAARADGERLRNVVGSLFEWCGELRESAKHDPHLARFVEEYHAALAPRADATGEHVGGVNEMIGPAPAGGPREGQGAR